MQLTEWRKKERISRVQLTKSLGITSGINPSQRLRSYEIGSTAVPILLVPKILELTNGEVTLDDLIEPRRVYLASRDAEAK